jgi:DNA-binding transcriptional MerR regulator
VTVRTLHHYDESALEAERLHGVGFRLYRDSDFVRLQQIVTPAHRVLTERNQTLLERKGAGLSAALGTAHDAGGAWHLDAAIQAIAKAEGTLRPAQTGLGDVSKITEEIKCNGQ